MEEKICEICEKPLLKGKGINPYALFGQAVCSFACLEIRASVRSIYEPLNERDKKRIKAYLKRDSNVYQ